MKVSKRKILKRLRNQKIKMKKKDSSKIKRMKKTTTRRNPTIR